MIDKTQISTKRKPTNLIVSPAVVLNDNRLFVWSSYEDCMAKIKLYVTDETIKSTTQWFLTTEWSFVDPYEAGKIALQARQIGQYTPELKPEDIFFDIHSRNYE